MLLTNARIICNDSQQSYYETGALLFRDGLIVDIGSSAELEQKYSNEEKRNLGGKLLLPGFINAHTHIYSAYARGMAVSKVSKDFQEILENVWWSLDRKLELEDCKLNAYTTMIDSLRNGVTTILDHHSSPNAARGSLFALAEAAREVGLRSSFCYEVSDRDGERILAEEIAENMDFIRACQKDDHNDLIKAMFGLHASFTVSDRSLEKVRTAMAGYSNGYHIHVAEGRGDEPDSLHKYGKRIGQRLFDWGILGEQTLAIHGIHCAASELALFKESRTMMVHNPMSNMGNAVGAAPIVEILRQGILCGLGTDAYTTDMIESMQVAKILQSHSLQDPTVGFGEALTLQLQNNPQIAARFYKQPLGVLQPGAYADLITLDYRPSTPLNGQNWGGHLLFGCYGAMVQDAYVQGRELMRGREILTVDEEAILARSQQRAAQIWPLM